MLVLAAVLLILVGTMHSVLGGRRLITPLLRRSDFPVLLGSQRNGRITLWVGWHALTLFWWAQAAALLAIALDEGLAFFAFLTSLALACAIVGLAAVFLTRGRHLSWIFFLPVAALLCAALVG